MEQELNNLKAELDCLINSVEEEYRKGVITFYEKIEKQCDVIEDYKTKIFYIVTTAK